MLTVKSSFTLNGKDYVEGDQVDETLLEADDLTDLISRDILVAEKKSAPRKAKADKADAESEPVK